MTAGFNFGSSTGSAPTQRRAPSFSGALRSLTTTVEAANGLRSVAATNDKGGWWGRWPLAAGILGTLLTAGTALFREAKPLLSQKIKQHADDRAAGVKKLEKLATPQAPAPFRFTPNAKICNETTCEPVRFKAIDGGRLGAERQDGTTYENCGQGEDGKRWCSTASGKMSE